MALDTIENPAAYNKGRETGLIFDTEGVTLLSRFSDQLSAYRSRKQWTEILNSYFLLEDERDYEMSILTDIEHDYFVLNCYFVSACGRYAFWRLINDQAPEAETKLCESSVSTRKQKPKSFPSLWRTAEHAELPTPWILTADDQPEPLMRRGLLRGMKENFKRIFRRA